MLPTFNIENNSKNRIENNPQSIDNYGTISKNVGYKYTWTFFINF